MTDETKDTKSTSNANPSDLLANERTFLAWVRTSVGIMAFGFVVVKFTLFVKQLSIILQRNVNVPQHGYSSAIGIFLVAFGALVGLMAFVRFRNIEKQLQGHNYKSSLWLTTVLAVIIFVVGAVLVAYLVYST